jgi:hypothetical protein
VIASPCHDAKILLSLGDGVLIGSCESCGDSVVRRNPRTGVEEWLDGQSPWTTSALRTVDRPQSARDETKEPG